ncbi:alpha/beta hydrolase family protein [Shewanella woodyi]|uniref:Peptidase S9 prolyl oligopeptidase active site domain protein n=1 Tax=Shewanella woodyi (strain ATCC 51908 / MS32) TaxID=392500 RepID=B1KR09_SHEWM|nr:S9 family peptidase [Shewanella woodyi]ACA84826.1 peptidase S9 prolyl oligopeptidase active site domain protein [Shewanella woodyi ATCC 51908]
MSRIFIALLLILSSAAVHAEQLPVEAFGLLPQSEQVKLSPDGDKLSFIIHNQGNTYIGVKDFKADATKYVVSTDNQEFKIGWYRWANNELLLVSADYPVKQRGIKYTETRLLKVHADGSGKLKTVMKPKKRELNPQFQNGIIDLLPDEPDYILMGLALKVANRPDVYKINLNSERKRKLLQRSRSDIHSWLTDQQHRVRLGYGRDETKIFYRLYDLATDEWRNIWEYEIFDAPDITPLGFGLNPSELYIRAIHNDRYAIFKVDVTDKKLTKTLVYADEHYDIEGSLIYSRKTKDVIGVYHGEANNAKVYFDPAYERFQKSLNKAIPDAYNNIVSVSDDENMYVLYTSNPQTPGAYYLGDRKAKTLEFIIDEYPFLLQKNLSDKRKVSYQARDGLSIEAYVTPPYEGVESKKAALVIPHGGPMVRNYGGFDWFSQFFASRGYTVIEPNFRGSSGYGFEFEMASIQKWGGAMQDDLADAAKWLTKNYPVDKNKVCILGASYGGYAAMMAAVKQQDVFRCAASFAGVSDLEYIVRKAKRFTNYKVVKKQIGDDSDMLEQKSPVNFAKEINIPLLLIHGDKDRVVDVYHSREMFEELEDLGKVVEYIELENGNHYLEIEKNRLKTLNAFDKFLTQHLN